MTLIHELDDTFNKPPPTYKQMLSMTIVVAVGVVLATVSAAIAAIDIIHRDLLWRLLPIPFFLAGLATISIMVSYRQRKTFLRYALSTAMAYEEYIAAVASGREDSVIGSVYSYVLNNAREWRDYALANNMDDVAERFQRAIIRSEGGYHPIRGGL